MTSAQHSRHFDPGAGACGRARSRIPANALRCLVVAFITASNVSGVAAAPPSHAQPPLRPSRAVDNAPAIHTTDDLRFTSSTPEQMIKLAAARTSRGGAEGLAGLAMLAELAPNVSANLLISTIAGIHVQRDARVQEELKWLAAQLSTDAQRRRPAGLIRAWAVIGPFEDTGGGLQRHDGPEQTPSRLVNLGPADRYDRGAYMVRWNTVPEELVTASGIPLDAMISPRNESCTYLMSELRLAGQEEFVLHIAGSGALRVALDGSDVALSEENHPKLRFERIAVAVDASAGDHLLVVKNCTGALADEGRLRVRVSDGQGHARNLPWGAGLLRDPGSGYGSSKVTALRTAMQDVLDTGDAPSVRNALYAGLVRALGGADDSRSPRSPGLFDRVVRDPSASSDVLATVGWATPFGADRTGRLNEAAEHAARERDNETHAFAQRRLASLRTAGGYSDWAMATVQAEPLASAQDVEARLIRSLAMGAAWTLRAPVVQQLERLAKEAIDTPSVWEALAEVSSQFDRGLAAKARERLRALDPESDSGSYVRAMHARNALAVVGAVNRCLAEGVISSDELAVMGRALIDAGRIREARELYQKAVARSPNVAELWDGLSVAGHASAEASDHRMADEALARARALSPGEVRFGAEARLRSRAFQSQDAGLVEPSVIMAKRASRPVREGEEADRELYWKRAVQYLPDHRVTQTVQYAREVLVAPRSQAELIENIPLLEGDTMEVLRARVHRAGGGLAFAEEQQSEGGRPRVRWARLEKGDVVEVAVRSHTAAPVGRRGDAPFYFMDYAGAVETHPLLYNEVTVETPAGQPLGIDVMNGEPDERTEQERDGRRIVRLVWTRPVNVPDEPLAPHPSSTIPMVVGSTFGSWKEFLDWYRVAVNGFTEPDDQVRRLAAELTKGARTEREKVQRVFNYVADTIRYVNYVSGEWWLPNRPQQVIARRQGDCDDKAILLITLLKAVGIEATEVLVQTRLTGQPRVLQSQKAAVPLFDHGIAYLPGKDGAAGLWLDATSPQSRLGPLPAMDARAQALVVKEGSVAITPMPLGAPSEHGVDSEWRIVLDATGGGELAAQEDHVGDHGFTLRTNLLEPAARAQWVEGSLLAGWFSGMRLEGKVGFDADLGQGRARVTFRARSEGMARREGTDWVVTLAPNSTMTSQLAPLLDRKLPVVLPPYYAPSHQTKVIRITAPRGYGFGPLPPGGEERGGEFGTAKLQIAFDPGQPNTVVLTRSITLDMDTIPVSQYGQWRTWLQRVDALMHRGVRLVPKHERGKTSS